MFSGGGSIETTGKCSDCFSRSMWEDLDYLKTGIFDLLKEAEEHSEYLDEDLLRELIHLQRTL